MRPGRLLHPSATLQYFKAQCSRGVPAAKDGGLSNIKFCDLFIIFARDQRPGLPVYICCDYSVAFHEFTKIWFIACYGRPAAEHERDGSVCQHPLAVVFPCDVRMRACCLSAFARGMANVVVMIYPGTQGNDVFGCNMQIHNVPAGLLMTITI